MLVFAIKGNYYSYDPKEEYGRGMTPAFMGLEGPQRIYVWDDNICARTKLFDTKQEAEDYLYEHYLKEHPDNKFIWGQDLKSVMVELREV